MALTRRRSENLWPQPFETGFDWAMRPFENWRRLLEVRAPVDERAAGTSKIPIQHS
jgi:hypothetical protein